jgi:hypothetical protein
MNSKEKIISDYSNWLQFLINTQNELNELEKLGAMCYMDVGMLNVFYARLQFFISTRWSYIDDEKKIKNELEKIGDNIFSIEYLEDINKYRDTKKYPPKLVNYNRKQLKRILQIFDLISKSFVKYRILYAVEKQKETIGAVRTQY